MSNTKVIQSNDKFVALELLKNANIASGMILPGCQDTGTAIIMGKRGQFVFTDGKPPKIMGNNPKVTMKSTFLGVFTTHTPLRTCATHK